MDHDKASKPDGTAWPLCTETPDPWFDDRPLHAVEVDGTFFDFNHTHTKTCGQLVREYGVRGLEGHTAGAPLSKLVGNDLYLLRPGEQRTTISVREGSAEPRTITAVKVPRRNWAARPTHPSFD